MEPEEQIKEEPFLLTQRYTKLENLDPISYAAKHGLNDYIEKALSESKPEERASILKMSNPENVTALHLACRYGQVPCAKTLLQFGALSSKTASSQLLPVHMIFNEKNDASTCLELFNLFADDHKACKEKTSLKETVAHFAAAKGLTSILKLVKNIDKELLSAKDTYSMTPLFKAVLNNQREAVQYLLGNCDCNQTNSKGQHALHLAVLSSSLDIVKDLLPHFDSNSPDNEFRSALDLAIHSPSREKEEAIRQYPLQKGNANSY